MKKPFYIPTEGNEQLNKAVLARVEQVLKTKSVLVDNDYAHKNARAIAFNGEEIKYATDYIVLEDAEYLDRDKLSLDYVFSDEFEKDYGFNSYANDVFEEYSKEANESARSNVISPRKFAQFYEACADTRLSAKVKQGGIVSIWTERGAHVHMKGDEFRAFARMMEEMIADA